LAITRWVGNRVPPSNDALERTKPAQALSASPLNAVLDMPHYVGSRASEIVTVSYFSTLLFVTV